TSLEADVLGVHEEVEDIPGDLIDHIAGVAEAVDELLGRGHLAACHIGGRTPRLAVVRAAALEDGVWLGRVTTIGATIIGGQDNAVTQVGKGGDAVVGSQYGVNGVV